MSERRALQAYDVAHSTLRYRPVLRQLQPQPWSKKVLWRMSCARG